MTKTPSFQQLEAKLQQISALKQAQAVLHYDQLVFMPEAPETADARGKQLAAMATIIHEKSTDPSLGELLASIQETIAKVDHDDDQRRLLQLATKEYHKQTKIPAELEARRASLSASSYNAWVKARQNNDFESYAPTLQLCFDTAKETAQALLVGMNQQTPNDNLSLYDVLLDEYEQGMSATRIDEIFQEIKETLVPLIQRVLASTHKPDISCLSGKKPFPLDKQKEMNRRIVTQLGFDETHGRIDVSVHPFTTSFSPADVRITSRFSTDEWYQGLAGSIHEGGHAMYEQNVGPSGTPLDEALSMGCHESQSLFWERHVGLSKPFWKYASPLLKEYLDIDDDPMVVYGAVNHVSPSFIRVEADELTYPLHVILRYNIERDILEGKLAVKDLPARWNGEMKELLNVEVPDDSKGCLQDVHWPSLAIGYFPTYLLGSATAAQLAHYCQKDIPDFDAKVEAGEFAEIKSWLTEKVHKHGRRYSSLDLLLEDQLGERLNPKYFLDYLTNKYTELYKC